MEALKSTSATFLKARGRRWMCDHVERLRSRVCRSVAAEETKAQALGEKVFEAASSKSCVDMREARGGLEGFSRTGDMMPVLDARALNELSLYDQRRELMGLGQ